MTTILGIDPGLDGALVVVAYLKRREFISIGVEVAAEHHEEEP